jgi:uncharacterized membrane protein
MTGLLLLSAVPLVAGAVRLTELGSGAAITSANARFFASPLPVILHIVGAVVYAILGAFQFATGLRQRRPGWHRRVGRLVIGSGLVVALSGLWMAHFYELPVLDGALLYAFRLLFGSLMAAALVLGFAAIRRGNVGGHRAWMMRGYAGVDPGGRGSDRWPAERTQPSAPDGCGLGDQPRRGRMGHPQAACLASPLPHQIVIAFSWLVGNPCR